MAAFRSFRPGKVWPDTNGKPINARSPGYLFHDGVYYWFGEERVPGRLWTATHRGVHCYSSSDLYNWQDRGPCLGISSDPSHDLALGHPIERPKVLYNAKTGKFVMWFHLEFDVRHYRAARVGVAVADRPVGPYRYLESFRPNAGCWPSNVPDLLKQPLSVPEAAALAKVKFRGSYFSGYPIAGIFRRDFAGGQMSRDMTLFMDDDGAAYHVGASEENGTLHVSRLTDNFLHTRGPYIRLFPARFHEAPALFKHQGRYYLISSDCTGCGHNPARSAVADSIYGPWTELGNPCVGPKADTTFDIQATYILPVQHKPGSFIFTGDRWYPRHRDVWLPLQFQDDRPRLEWCDEWDLSFFDRLCKPIS